MRSSRSPLKRKSGATTLAGDERNQPWQVSWSDNWLNYQETSYLIGLTSAHWGLIEASLERGVRFSRNMAEKKIRPLEFNRHSIFNDPFFYSQYQQIMAKLTNHFQQTRLLTPSIDWQTLFTWISIWLPLRLSKRQSSTKVLFRTTLI